MAQVVGRGQVSSRNFLIRCFNCGADVLYKDNEIHRNPGLRMVVSNHGFSGFSGEVHCPSCGTWLPHFDANEVFDAQTVGSDPIKTCPGCGAQVVPGNAFCGQCGTKLN